MKKLLSVISAMAVMLAMGGCESKEAEQVSETVAETVQSEKLTFEDVNVIEINGRSVSLPFKVEELGEGYSIVEVQGYNERVPAIYYNNQCLAVIENYNGNDITSLTFTSDSFEHNSVEICNLSSSDNFQKIIDTVGEPSRQKELALIYEFDNGELYFGSEDGSSGFNYVEIELYDNSEQ